MFFSKFRTLSALLAATLALCIACSPTPPETNVPKPSIPPSHVLENNPPFTPTPTPTPAPAPQPPPPQNGENVASEFWDVSNVDISEIDVTKKHIAFTFDDAPSSTLEQILAVFTSFNETHPHAKASATLFCNGHLLNPSSAHTLRSAVALGWELGNHTYSHADLTQIDDTAFLSELTRTQALLQKIDNKNEHLFRAPFGKLLPRQKNLIGVPIIDWTIDTLDWTGNSSEEICTAVLSAAFDGAIVLMHDGYKNTVTALKTLLPALYENGYQITGVSQLSKANACPLKRGSRYIRARKSRKNT